MMDDKGLPKSLFHCCNTVHLILLQGSQAGGLWSDILQQWIGLTNVVYNVLQCPMLAKKGMAECPGAVAHTPQLCAHCVGLQLDAKRVNQFLEKISGLVDA